MTATLRVIKAGLQTTLQGAPFVGHRHLGMPAAGAADCLSLALANHLVGNDITDIAIELTLDDAKFVAGDRFSIALVGASDFLRVNGEERSLHRCIPVNPGDEIHIGPATKGCRSYLAIGGRLSAQTLLGGQSTYLTASLGGFRGRALQKGDCLEIASHDKSIAETGTPVNLSPTMTSQFLLRITPGPEFALLCNESQSRLAGQQWRVSARTSRMGMMLDGEPLETTDASQMASAPVFSGTLQCPPDGQPFLLGPDAQTTGGYPRVAQVIRADRHLIGQLKSGSAVRFLITTPERASKIYREKLMLLEPWLGPVNLW